MFVYVMYSMQHFLPVVQHERGRETSAARLQERGQVCLAHLQHHAQELVGAVILTAMDKSIFLRMLLSNLDDLNLIIQIIKRNIYLSFIVVILKFCLIVVNSVL